jgi:hypothetical protein
MTIAAAGVRKALAGLWDKLPVVAVGLESELQNAESCRIAQFAVRLRLFKGTMVLATRTDDEFANSPLRIRRAFRILRSESFIVVVVTVDDHIRVGVIERLEERLYSRVVAVSAVGTEQRLVPIGEGASDGMRGEVRAQPFFLGRAGLTSVSVLAFTVQHDDVPLSELVAVVAGFGGTGECEFMIASGGAGARFYAAPGFVVAIVELFFCAGGVSEVADSLILALQLWAGGNSGSQA